MFKLSQTKMLVCDMAGTIIKEKGIVYDALYNTIKVIQPSLMRRDINDFYGCQKSEVIKHFVDKNIKEDKNVVQNNLESEFNYFLKKEYNTNPNISLINPNIPSFFNALRDQDIKITLNTGYNKDIQKLLIDKFNLSECIDDYISSEEVKYGRPYPHMIHSLMNKHNISNPSQVIKVGDTIADILEGKNAGCHTVSVLSGSCKRSILEKHVPNYILNDIMELKIN